MATPNVVPRAAGEGGIGTSPKGWGGLFATNTTTSSANQGAILQLSADDGAAMGDSHRMGVIYFKGAEDTSNTLTTGARIEALTDAAWTNAENGGALYFYTTDGNASETLVFKMDSNARASFPEGKVGVGTTVPVTGSTLGLEVLNTTTSAAGEGGAIRLGCNDGAVMASGHRLGVIEFAGAEDTSSTMTVGARIEAICDNTWSASENGADLVFYTTDGNASQGEAFRLTAEGYAVMSGPVGIGTGGAPAATLEVENDDGTGVAAVLIDNNDADQMALDIDATNTTANIIDISHAGQLSASVIHIDHNQSLLTGNVNSDFINIDYDKTAVTGDGNTSNQTGINLNMLDGATNHANATSTQTGLEVYVANSSNQGTVTNTGMTMTAIGGDTNTGIQMRVTDGGSDIVMVSSADSGDYATIAVGAAGATTITTVDDDGTDADLTFTLDGEFILQSTGINKLMRSTNTDDFVNLNVGGSGGLQINTTDAAGTTADLDFNIDGNIQMFSKSADYAQTISYGAGRHIVVAELELTDANTTDGGVIKQLPGIKIPQFAYIKVIHVTVTELSNLGTFDCNITVGTDTGVAAGTAPANPHEILGAGVNYSYKTDDVAGTNYDIAIGSGTGNLKKNWYNIRNMNAINSDGELTVDHYVYVCSGGTGNGTSDATSGKIYVYLEYFGMD